jgi:hypothetical protein
LKELIDWVVVEARVEEYPDCSQREDSETLKFGGEESGAGATERKRRGLGKRI